MKDKFERLAAEIKYELDQTNLTIAAYERELFGWYDTDSATFFPATVHPEYKPVTIAMRQRHIFKRNTLGELLARAHYIRRTQ